MYNMNEMDNVLQVNMAPAGMSVNQPLTTMYPSNLIQTIQHCATICDHMITHLLHHQELSNRRRQLELLRDCADICHLTASMIARNSSLSKVMAHICAQICELCGNECLKFADRHSQHCAQVCLHCAQACRSFAMSA